MSMVSVLALIIGVVVGVLVGQDANKRGMNGTAWGLGVFFLMIIVLPIYFITPKPKLTDSTTDTDILDDGLSA